MNIIKNLDSQEIIKSIEPYQVVTFDVFDTLVKRDIKSFIFFFLLCLLEGSYYKSNNALIAFCNIERGNYISE